MVQQVINVGATANDRTGDTWREAFIKVNSNETELFDFKDSQSFVFIAQESDFPVQDATTITLESNMVYVVSTNVTTGKRFICEDGSVMTMFNGFGPILTYTGSGTMFTGTDAGFAITAMRIVCANAQAFAFTDTIGKLKIFTCNTVSVLGCLKMGTFDNLAQAQFFTSFALCDTGIKLLDDQTLLTIERLGLISSSATFIGIDIGTVVIDNFEVADLVVIAPAGGIGISGTTASANIPSGSLAMLRDSSFTGGLTTILQNITTDDIRWSFRDNTGITDSFPDGLLSFVGNSTETVISSTGVAVIVNAIWAVISFSQFTGTTGGRLTYNAERDLPGPIDVAIGLISAGGGSIDVQVCIALNGSVIAETCTPITISGSNPASLSIPWQLTLTENDFIEVFVQNDTNTTNIIVEYCRLRIR